MSAEERGGRHQCEALKDEVLNALADRANVAQFVSFAPDLSQRYVRVRGREPNHLFSTLEAACSALLEGADSGCVNVRSFRPS